jgi:hypothetical protein
MVDFVTKKHMLQITVILAQYKCKNCMGLVTPGSYEMSTVCKYASIKIHTTNGFCEVTMEFLNKI